MNIARCVHVFREVQDMTAFLVKRWSQIALECVHSKGSFVTALSGGTTPSAFYRTLASTRDTLPWDKTHIFLADERCVAFSNIDSNYGMIRSVLIESLKMSESNIHPVKANTLSPARAAEEYEAELKRFFGFDGNEMPRFDFIGLGIGTDGHTASLFPGYPQFDKLLSPAEKRLAVNVRIDGIKHERISLTLAVINNASNVVFIVTGKNKASIVKRVVEERDQGFPASRVEPADGTLTFVLDSEAASMLK